MGATEETSEQAERADQVYREQLGAQRIGLDRMFAKLMVCQWVFAIAIAVVISPYGWAGKEKVVHGTSIWRCSWARALRSCRS